MKTLHLDTGREMRGGQWQVLRLVRGLARRGDQPKLMAREDSQLFEIAKAEGLEVCRLTTLGLPQMARQADLVHAHDARAHMLASLFRRAPLVVARRVAFPIGTSVLSRRKYRTADAFLAVSRYVSAILAGGGVPERKIHIVPDGVPLLPLSTRTGGIITPASNDPLKGVRLGLDAAHRLGVQLIPSDNLERDLATASLFVYITHSEGLGSAAMLAMSAGVPVIASNLGGLAELVRPGEEGLLVENEPGAIAGAMRTLLADEELARRYGAQGRHRVEMCFTEDQMVNKTRDVYRKLLAHD